MPNPSPLNANMYPKPWTAACIQTSPLTDETRINKAPRGNTITNVNAMIVPWAMMARFAIATSPSLASSLISSLAPLVAAAAVITAFGMLVGRVVVVSTGP